jgi:16S rRNA (adenine1518-N6/adenine1519-N6)-dimethyltransferase
MTTVRKILRDNNILPSRRLGQSFLEDKNIINKIIAAADIRSDDIVVEIGAGLGIITDLLAARARKVIAIDVDPRMTIILRERFKDRPNVSVVEQDILSYDFSSARVGDAQGRLKVVGNIPYNISTQILFHLLEFRLHVFSMLLMLQREVANRIVAVPGSKDYGIPSVIVSLYAIVSKEMNVPASCFYPHPKVVSSLIKIVIRERLIFEPEDDDFFRKVVKIAFAKRRKTLLNNLRSADFLNYTEKELNFLLGQINIDGSRRGETLSVEEFVRLSDALFTSKYLKNPFP